MRRLVRPHVSLPTLVQVRRDFPVTTWGSPGAEEAKWNNPDVRGAIYAMHGRVCAYCQRVASDSRGDVEHFRPKSIYPWLMYEFLNYLLGCRVCNSTRKSNRFPLARRARAVTFRPRMDNDAEYLRRVLSRERRLLLDPVEDPVEEWMDIDFDNPLCPIRFSGSGTADRLAQPRVLETVNFFGLNVIPELIEDRFTHVNAVLDTLEAWRDGDTARADELRALANRYKPHGWTVRHVITRLAPTLDLPSGEEDLNWLIEQTLDRLDRDDLVLAGNIQPKDREMVRQRREEARWTLAVLWKDPPFGSPADVEYRMNARGRREEIAPYFAQL